MICAGPALAFDLKGFRMGMPLPQFTAKFPGARCSADNADPDKVSCQYVRVGLSENVTELNTLAEVLVDLWMFVFYGEKLGFIYVVFPSDEFSTVRDAMSAKFGKPNIAKVPMQNRLGSVIEKSVHTWKDAEGTLTLESVTSTTKSSSVTFSAPWFAERDRRSDAKAGKAKAKDL